MTANSILCQFIHNYPDDWRERLAEKKVRVSSCDKYPELLIFTYDLAPLADFSDPVVCECRGIIVKFPELQVVCWPFGKFNNYDSEYAADIDWASARVQEKIDGSLIKLYYYDNHWQWATNGCILAEDAPCGDASFLQLIHRCDNFHDVPLECLDKNKTYMFELVSPEKTIVVNYHLRRLFHLGTRDNVTGREERGSIGVIRPAEYPLTSLEAVVQFVNSRGEKASEIKYEGCVVVDKDFNRIKVKSEDYFLLHALMSNGKFPKKLCVEILKNPEMDAEEIRTKFPVCGRFLDYYARQISETEELLSLCINEAKDLLKAGAERRDVYERFRDCRVGFQVMKWIDSRKSARELLDALWKIRKDRYLALLPEYTEEAST